MAFMLHLCEKIAWKVAVCTINIRKFYQIAVNQMRKCIRKKKCFIFKIMKPNMCVFTICTNTNHKKMCACVDGFQFKITQTLWQPTEYHIHPIHTIRKRHELHYELPMYWCVCEMSSNRKRWINVCDWTTNSPLLMWIQCFAKTNGKCILVSFSASNVLFMHKKSS